MEIGSTSRFLRPRFLALLMLWNLPTVTLAPDTKPETAVQSPVTAVDVLLEPDATMLQHAAANNARLLKVYAQGFALDATHRPHITLIKRVVRTADLDKVYAAAHRVFAAANLKAMKLEAFKYYYAPGGA